MKRDKRKILIVSVLLILVMTLTGCAKETGSVNSSNSTENETKTVRDCAGRKVAIPKNPQKVACLYASAAHMMAMLDEQDKIIGCPTGVKSDVLMQEKFPGITETAIPSQQGTINAEEMLRIKADLALINSSLAENTGETDKLKELGIPYIVIDYMNIKELYNAIKVVGNVFGKSDKADRYIEFCDETFEMVNERLSGIDDANVPKVYHSVNEATRTDPVGSICNEIIKRAKVQDISVDKGAFAKGKNVYVTLEEIYNWNPDAFICNESTVTDYILNDSKWNSLDAVKQGKVYTLPVGATRWCHPGSMEPQMGTLAIACRFYPEEFEDFDLKKYVKEYYKDQFNLVLDDETVEKILAGEGMRKSNSPTN